MRASDPIAFHAVKQYLDRYELYTVAERDENFLNTLRTLAEVFKLFPKSKYIPDSPNDYLSIEELMPEIQLYRDAVPPVRVVTTEDPEISSDPYVRDRLGGRR